MKEKLLKASSLVFFVSCVLMTIGGAALFLSIVYGLFIGGESGSAALIFGQKIIVPIYEGIMGIAVFIGIISMYISKTFAYRLDKK